MSPDDPLWQRLGPSGASGSILEPLGVVLGASGVDSGAFQGQFEVDFWFLRAQGWSQKRVLEEKTHFFGKSEDI